MQLSPLNLIRRHIPRYTSRLASRNFTVLAVESSADDTCAAVVTSAGDILSNVVIKQHELHEQYGGIHPFKAIKGHQRNMPLAVSRALKEANADISKDINGIAFTRGPGMAGCLSVGLNAAQTLAAVNNLPIVGVHHMQAHALTPLLTAKADPPKFPFLTLLISGGHTLLLLATSMTEFKILATTPDASIGRAFDHVAKILKIDWQGLGPGAALEKFCEQNLESTLPTVPDPPRPMRGQLAFSYASMHSYVERFIAAQGGIDNLDLPTRVALARKFQDGAFLQLEDKLLLAFDWCTRNGINVRDVVVSGGVASNLLLRQRLDTCLKKLAHPVHLNFPPPALCTDNAVMIAWASMPRFLGGDNDHFSMDLRSQWSIEDLNKPLISDSA